MLSWQYNYGAWILQNIRVTEYKSYSPTYRIERYGDHVPKSNLSVLCYCYLKDREHYFLVYSKGRCENEDLVLVAGILFFFNLTWSIRQIYAVIIKLPGTVTWPDTIWQISFLVFVWFCSFITFTWSCGWAKFCKIWIVILEGMAQSVV